MNATPRRAGAARRRYLAALVNAGEESGDEEGSRDDEDEYAHSTGSDSNDESMSPEKQCTLDAVRLVAVRRSSNKGAEGARPEENPASVAPASPLLGSHKQACSPMVSASPACIQRSPEELASSPLLGSHKQACTPLVSASPARIQRSPEELASALEALHLGSPGKRMCGKQGVTSVEAFMVSSPAKRLRSKQDAPLVQKRSHMYCQQDSCVFNRFEPGQPARKVGNGPFCAWCDDEVLSTAMKDRNGVKNLKVSLACFKKKDLEVYRLAIQKLDGLEMHYTHSCDNLECVYSTAEPGWEPRTDWWHGLLPLVRCRRAGRDKGEY